MLDQRNAEAHDFHNATFDFLLPAQTHHVHCRTGARGCSPSLFKCRHTEHLVEIDGMSQDHIDEARHQCNARNTCIDPIGGEGSLVETPIPDDPIPANLIERPQLRETRLANLQLGRWIAVVLVVLLLLARASRIFLLPKS